MRKEKTMANLRLQKIKRDELAQRIYDLDVYEAWDADQMPDTIADMIYNDPLSVIEYLVSMVEDMQA